VIGCHGRDSDKWCLDTMGGYGCKASIKLRVVNIFIEILMVGMVNNRG